MTRHPTIPATILALCIGACGEPELDGPRGFSFAEEEYRLTAVLHHLEEENDEVALFGVSGIAAVDDGYLMSDTRNQRLVLVGPDLGFRGTVGRGGEGPGEYEMPTAVARLGERVAVLDESANRVSYLSESGDFLASAQLGGTASDLAVHPSMGVFTVSTQFEGFYLSHLTDDGEVPFARIPDHLQTDARAKSWFTEDQVAVTPDGLVHVLDEPAVVLLTYAADGELLEERPLPSPFTDSRQKQREGLSEAFGSRVVSVSVISDLIAMPDGRLFVLSSSDGLLGLVLDLEKNTATPMRRPGLGPLSWVPGGSSALFDGQRFLLTNITWVAIFETELVRISQDGS